MDVLRVRLDVDPACLTALERFVREIRRPAPATETVREEEPESTGPPCHTTRLLRILDAANHKFWDLYDPEDPTTAPTNEQVSEWLHEKHGVSRHVATVMAQILRADGLPMGRRPV